MVAENAALAHHGMRVGKKVVSDLNGWIEDDVGQDRRVSADLYLWTDDGVGADVRALANYRGGIDDCRGVNSLGVVRGLIEDCKRLGKGEIWIRQPEGRRLYFRKLGIDEDGGCLGGSGKAGVFGVSDEGNFGGPGFFDASDAGHFEAAVPAQLRPQPLSQLRQFHCAIVTDGRFQILPVAFRDRILG